MVHERSVRIGRRLAAIMATDVAGYSRLMHDDETGDDLQRPCAYLAHAAADDAVATVDDFG